MNLAQFLKRQALELKKHGGTVTSERSKSSNCTTYFIGKPLSAIREDIITDQWKNISTAFGLPDNVKDLFAEAISGAGNEWIEINQFNSSSLLAFLCFHGVSANKTINIDNVNYDEVHFEVQSPLKQERRSKPVSNMDIVLIGKDNETGSKHALFLESKFTEYLSSKKPDVSSYYKKYYKDLFGENIDFGEFKFTGKKWDSKKSAYLEGVKQMICHYLGIANSLENQSDLPESAKYWKDGTLQQGMRFHLREILFDFADEKIKNYRSLYDKLLPKLNEHARRHRLNIVVEELITYQDLFKNNMEVISPIVKDFYNFTK